MKEEFEYLIRLPKYRRMDVLPWIPIHLVWIYFYSVFPPLFTYLTISRKEQSMKFMENLSEFPLFFSMECFSSQRFGQRKWRLLSNFKRQIA